MPRTDSRRPRFRRCSENVPPIQLTSRDAEIIRKIAEYRFLTSSQIVSLVDGNAQPILRRLQLLYHHGYLDRPRAQLDNYYRSGSQPMVYGLASRGAAFLRREFNLPFHRMEWSRDGTPPGRLFLEHALMTSEIMVCFERSCRSSERLKLCHLHDLDLPSSVRDQRDLHKWRIALPKIGKLGVIPDRIFSLESPKNGSRVLYFLEADRGTMPVVRKTLDQTSIFRKLLAYQESWNQEIHKERFGFDRFRVLFVTKSAERMDHMIDACQSLDRGKGLFLFATLDSLGALEDAFDLEWTSGAAGRRERLMP